MHCQNLRPGHQRPGEFVKSGQISSDHQRRPENAPQGHHGHLFVRGEPGAVFRVVILQNRPDRKHVGIRPVPRAGMAGPSFRAGKHIVQKLPPVPEIVGDPPHIAGLPVKARVFSQRGAGADRQHHFPSAASERFADHLQLARLPGHFPADIVQLDKVDFPFGVQRENAVVVGSAARMLRIQPVHVRIPLADVGGLRDLSGGIFASVNRKIPVYRESRNPAHDMDAEFQAERVDIFGERPESLSARGGGKTVDGGNQPPVFVHGQFLKRNIVMGFGLRSGPLDIDHNIFPAVGLQVFRHPFGVLPYGVLRHSRAVAVPAVPSHRRPSDHGLFCAVHHSVSLPLRGFCKPAAPSFRAARGFSVRSVWYHRPASFSRDRPRFLRGKSKRNARTQRHSAFWR